MSPYFPEKVAIGTLIRFNNVYIGRAFSSACANTRPLGAITGGRAAEYAAINSAGLSNIQASLVQQRQESFKTMIEAGGLKLEARKIPKETMV